MNDRALAGTTMLITGATDGLGLAVATDLAARGATLLIHGRHNERGQQALEHIRGYTGADRLAWYRADFAHLSQVAALADRILAEVPRLDVLVNNAGLGVEQRRSTSADGHEMVFQVGYLAPYLLTRRLLPLLSASAPARIVTVTSAGQAPIDFDDIMLTRRFDGVQAYCQAKLAEVMLTFDLSDELADNGVTANCLHPASRMPTKIVTGLVTPQSSVAEGVGNTVRLIVDPALDNVTGVYYDRGQPARAAAQAYDPQARQRLDTLARRLTGL